MPVLIRTRRIASGALSAGAVVLRGAARVTRLAADVVRPGHVAADDVADLYELRGRPAPPPQEPVAPAPEPVTHARTSPSHIAALAERPVSEVIAELDNLSTDELRLLLEHEEAHKRRKTLIEAIERSAEQHVP
jgi:hypothetical protein